MLAEIDKLFMRCQEKHYNYSVAHDHIRLLISYRSHSNYYQGGKILLVSVVNRLNVVSFYKSSGLSMF